MPESETIMSANDPAAKIFISYRRADICGRIRERLVEHFGDAAISKDVDDMPVGADVPRHIESILAQCAVMLVGIGPDWLEINDTWAPTEHQEEDKCRIALLS